MIKLSVIIPNFNGYSLLNDCLESLKKQTFKDFEIILVDNCSIDGSLEFVKTNFPEVRVIKLRKNYGFAKAINIGAKLSKARYLVFLNNDTKTDKNYLQKLVECADFNRDVISINPKILNFSNPSIIDGVGILINEVGQARSIGWQEKDLGQYNKNKYIFGATGGASLFKRLPFIKVGMFDEKYFMYSEEVDFAFRAQFLGFKSIYCPKAIVYHKHKATSKKYPQHIEYWQFKNMYQTIIKDFPLSILMKKGRLVKITLVFINTIFYQIKNGFFWPPVATLFWLVINLSGLLKQRRKIQLTKKVSDEYIENFLIPKKITLWGLRK